MNEELRRIISQSTFSVVAGTYVYAKVSKAPAEGEHFMVSMDGDEITVVTEAGNLGYLDMLERNKEDYCLIALNVSVPFYSVGFLAAASGAIADGGMNVLIVSTYSRDYLMVRKGQLEEAIAALKSIGFRPATRPVE